MGIVLETERAHLCTWDLEDTVQFHNIATNPLVVRYIWDGRPWQPERSQEFVERQIRNYKERGYCMWKLVARSTGELAGLCGLQPLRDSADIEIGWWLTPQFWGKGIATEVASAALRDAFTRVKLNDVVAIAMPENTASIRVMQKLGMRHAREMVYREIPVVMYAITQASWVSLSRDSAEARQSD